MELSNHINLADPKIRRALFETGKWSRIIAIISIVVLALVAIGAAIAWFFLADEMNEALFNNPMLPASPTYLVVMYTATVVLGIFVSILLFRFGGTLKGAGPMQPLGNTEINTAFGHLLTILKFYAVFSVLSLLSNVVMMFF